MTLLGIDLGTSSVKVIVLADDGQTLGRSQAEYLVLTPNPGWAESDPWQWWQATVTATQQALAQAPGVAITGIGLSGQMHGVVLTTSDGQPVRPALLWADTRATAVLERYRDLPASHLQALANPLVPGMAGPMLYWLALHEPAAYHAARWALQPKDWLRWQLIGTAASDPSDASATLLYDLAADGWAEDSIAMLGLRRELFPALLPSAQVAGVLREETAQLLGLPANIPVVTGAADTAAAALGTGVVDAGVIQLTLGTGVQVIQMLEKPAIDPTGQTHLYRGAADACWYRMAALQNGGLALNWVRNILGASWDELFASIAGLEPGADGLIFLPYLTGERTHRAAVATDGAWLGLRIDQHREQLLFAALEGVALSVRYALTSLPGTTVTPALRLAGGGSLHPAWRQMLADVLGRTLYTVAAPDASARGAALLAGIGTGIWSGVPATVRIAPAVQLAATPDPLRAARYAELYAQRIHLIQPA